MGNKFFLGMLVAAVLCLVFPVESAHAYLDPGTGSYVLQLVAASLLGGLFVFRTFWGRIKDFLVRLFSRRSRHQQ